MVISGGTLKNKDLKNLLLKSYNNKLESIDNWIINPELSNELVQVYKNSNSNQAIVVHRGTASKDDIITDSKLLFGFRNGNRYKYSRNIQQKAEALYGSNNVTTIGHSLGADIANEVGSNSHEIIILNRPITPLDVLKRKKVARNVFNIYTEKDPISLLKPMVDDPKKTIIKSETNNPLTEHSVTTLNRMPDDKIYGYGLKIRQIKQNIKDLKKNKKVKSINITGLKKSELVDLLNELLKL